MRERLLLSIIIIAVAICEIMDVVSKKIVDYFLRKQNH